MRQRCPLTSRRDQRNRKKSLIPGNCISCSSLPGGRQKHGSEAQFFSKVGLQTQTSQEWPVSVQVERGVWHRSGPDTMFAIWGGDPPNEPLIGSRSQFVGDLGEAWGLWVRAALIQEVNGRTHSWRNTGIQTLAYLCNMKDPFVYIAYYTFKCHEIVDASSNFIKSYKLPWHD